MQKLELAAQHETEETKVPCKYLGVKIGDHFEEDPEKWCEYMHPSKSHATVWFEFPGVLQGDAHNEPLRVSARANDLIGDNPRTVPNNPLRSSTSLGLTFTVAFMQEVAKNVASGATYQGITYEADRPDIKLDVPNGGQDIQREPVYWVLPGGRCVCKSLLAFAQLLPEELGEASTLEAYEAAAEELDFFFLGLGPDAEVEDFREAPGSLAQRRWLDVNWRVPDNEATLCWWIANISEQGWELFVGSSSWGLSTVGFHSKRWGLKSNGAELCSKVASSACLPIPPYGSQMFFLWPPLCRMSGSWEGRQEIPLWSITLHRGFSNPSIL